MHEGIYESLITRKLSGELDSLTELKHVIKDVPEADQAHVLARHVEAAVRRSLEGAREEDRRLSIVNGLMTSLGEAEAPEQLDAGVRQLLAITSPAGPGSSRSYNTRPNTP